MLPWHLQTRSCDWVLRSKTEGGLDVLKGSVHYRGW